MELEHTDLSERIAACKRRMDAAGDSQGLRNYGNDLTRLTVQLQTLIDDLESHYKLIWDVVLTGEPAHPDDCECEECQQVCDCEDCTECDTAYAQVRVRNGYKTPDGVFHDLVPPQLFPSVGPPKG